MFERLIWAGLLFGVSTGCFATTSLDLLGAVFGKEVIQSLSSNSINSVAGVGHIGDFFARLNLLIIWCGIAICIYKAIRGVVSTATTGELWGGDHNNNIWWLIRTCLGVVAIVPLPVGYSVAQFLAISILVQGSNLPNYSTSYLRDKTVIGNILSPDRLVKSSKAVIGPQMDSQLEFLLIALINAKKHNESLRFFQQNQQDQDQIKLWFYPGLEETTRAEMPENLVWLDLALDNVNNPKSFIVKLGAASPQSQQVDSSYGYFAFDIVDANYISMQFSALQDVLSGMINLASRLNASNGSVDLAKRDIRDISDKYAKALENIAECVSYNAAIKISAQTGLPLDKQVHSSCPASNQGASTLKAATASVNFDWLNLGVAYFFGNSASEKISNSINSVTLGNFYGQRQNKERPTSVNSSQKLQGISANTDMPNQDGFSMKNLKEKISQLNPSESLKTWTAQITQKITSYQLEGNKSPLAHMKAFGDTILAGISAFWAAYAFLSALAEAAVWTLVGSPLVNVASLSSSSILLAIAGFSWSLLKTFGFALYGAFIGLGIFGGLLAVYLPSVPFLLWISAVITWLITSVGGVISIGFAALFMIGEDGPGLFPGQARAILGILAGLLLRPLLLVIGFLFGLAIIEAVGGLVNEQFFRLIDQIEGASSNGMIVDFLSAIPKLLFWIMSYFGLMTMIIHHSMESIQAVPNFVLGLFQSSEPRHGNDDRVYNLIAAHFPRGIGGGGKGVRPKVPPKPKQNSQDPAESSPPN